MSDTIAGVVALTCYLLGCVVLCLTIAEVAKLIPDPEDTMSTDETPTTPIPVVGEASSPAELVTLLRRAHFQRHVAAEHDVDLDDRYVPTVTISEDREAA